MILFFQAYKLELKKKKNNNNNIIIIIILYKYPTYFNNFRNLEIYIVILMILIENMIELKFRLPDLIMKK